MKFIVGAAIFVLTLNLVTPGLEWFWPGILNGKGPAGMVAIVALFMISFLPAYYAGNLTEKVVLSESAKRIGTKATDVTRVIGLGVAVVIAAIVAIVGTYWLFTSVTAGAPPWAIAIIILLVLIFLRMK